ncbi:hypothetical protein [Sphingobacterium deserti]|uniref:Uncharacterized protein n=1 Tax=Sphingobacterium deserti TaxID=1229276 RepID=A0A0B8TAI0_9SPHI|nr:hypothetical protein [Sphingobacterium deserti]KGE15874.1 hypothetical protein DI53_0308 [Sphingobacterium deserti]
MKKFLLILFLAVTGFSVSYGQENVNQFRAAYPKARKDAALCKKQLAIIDRMKSPTPLELAYAGAFYAVWPEHLSSPLKKLNAFKKGKDYLEQAIKAEPGQVEIHFLRLTVQHNAPAMLGYNENKEEDLGIVLDKYDDITSTALRTNIKEFLLATDLLTDSQRKIFQ